MSRLSDARARLYTELSPVLPGRVEEYPPPSGQRYAAPRIWIEQPEVSRATVGARSVLAVATWPVWCVYDGADRAQVAGLDDLVSKCWDALMRAGADPQLARRDEVSISPTGSLRATVIYADVTLGASTLCLPDVTASPIPPAQTQEAAHG
jgi:hypothetical protein